MRRVGLRDIIRSIGISTTDHMISCVVRACTSSTSYEYILSMETTPASGRIFIMQAQSNNDREQNSNTTTLSPDKQPPSDQKFLGNGWRSWAIIATLSIVALLPALEGTVVSTALPTIVESLQGGKQYIWVVNSYFLTRCALHRFGAQITWTFLTSADRLMMQALRSSHFMDRRPIFLGDVLRCSSHYVPLSLVLESVEGQRVCLCSLQVVQSKV